jgi:DNA-binding SARP family transcriptional activator
MTTYLRIDNLPADTTSGGHTVLCLIDPLCRDRGRYLRHVLATLHDTPGCLYFRPTAPQLPLADSLRVLSDSLTAHVPGLIASLPQVLHQPAPHAWGEALALDLLQASARLAPHPLRLIVEDFDWLGSDAEQAPLLAALTTTLRARAVETLPYLIVAPRVLPTLLWAPFLENGSAILVTEPAIAPLTPPPARAHSTAIAKGLPPYRTLLQVFALGEGRVLLNGRPLRPWEGTLPRLLFFFLIDRMMATREDIFAALWHEMTPREATNVFHVTKRKLSDFLGRHLVPAQALELTRYERGYYLPSDALLRAYDVELFMTTLEQAEIAHDPAQRASALRDAVALYRGPFLASLCAPWVVRRREQLHALYVHALIDLARHELGARRIRHAFAYASRAAREAGKQPSLVFAALDLLAELGSREHSIHVSDSNRIVLGKWMAQLQETAAS